MPAAGSIRRHGAHLAATEGPGTSPGWGRGPRVLTPTAALILAVVLAWTPRAWPDIVDDTRGRATYDVPVLKQVGDVVNRIQAEVEQGAKAVVGKVRGETVAPKPGSVGARAGGTTVKPGAAAQPPADPDPGGVQKGASGKDKPRRAKEKRRPEAPPAGAAAKAEPLPKGARAPAQPAPPRDDPAPSTPAAAQAGQASLRAAPHAATATGVSALPIAATVHHGEAAPSAEPVEATSLLPSAGRPPSTGPTDVPAPPAPPDIDAPPLPFAQPQQAAAPAMLGPDPEPAATLAPDVQPVRDQALPIERPARAAPLLAPERSRASALAGVVFRDCDYCPEYVPIVGTDGEPGGAPRAVDQGGGRDGKGLSAFGMTQYEVTFTQYDRFCTENSLSLPADEGWGRGRRPAINVSYDDAVMYAAWLSKKTGRTYRLPTEAEWELAARAGTKTHYWWGDEMEPGRANCADCGGVGDGRQTAPVGSFEANAWGLFDTVGNVWEWTSSAWFDTSNLWPFRVVRGGSWSRDGAAAATDHRVFNSQSFRSPNLGFRVVREGPPPGGITVTASTAAEIFLNDRPVGEAGPDRPLVLASLAPGDYRIEAVAGGFAQKAEQHRVVPNAVTNISIVLESKENVAWQACAGATVIALCRDYLREYPDGGHVAPANEAMERLAWEECTQATGVEPCRNYLKDYPTGKYAEGAAERVHAAGWQACAAATVPGACAAYLKEYPKGSHAPDAADMVEGFEWQDCAAATAAGPCTAYLQDNPKGAHAKDAADKVEDFLWQACTSSSATGPCRDYVKAYPRGARVTDAQKRIDKAEEAEFSAAAKVDTADAWLAFIKSASSSARIKKAKGRLKGLKASPAIEFPRQVERGWVREGHDVWKWTVTFREKSGKAGYRVSGSGVIRDKQGSLWGSSGASISRGDIDVPAGGIGSDDYWLRGDKFCGAHAEFTWTGKDATGHSITLKERVLLGGCL